MKIRQTHNQEAFFVFTLIFALGTMPLNCVSDQDSALKVLEIRVVPFELEFQGFVETGGDLLPQNWTVGNNRLG